MSYTWSDITNDPAWQDFTPDQRNAVREHFYSTVVAPTADADGQGALRQQFEQLTGPSMVPTDGFWSGIAHGAERGASRAVRGLALANDAFETYTPFGMYARGVRDLVTGRSSQDDTYRVIDKARDFEESLPQARSKSARVGQAVGGFVPGILTAGAGEAGASGEDVAQRGTLAQAEGALGLSAAANEAGLLTGKLGGGVMSRMLYQGGANAALGQVQRVVGNQFLPEDMRQDFDPVEFGISVGAGVAGGLLPHERAPLAHGDDLLSNTPPNTPNTRADSTAQDVPGAGATVAPTVAATPLRHGDDLLATGGGTDAAPTSQGVTNRATPAINTDARASAQRNGGDASKLGNDMLSSDTANDSTSLPLRQTADGTLSGQGLADSTLPNGNGEPNVDSNAPASLDPGSPEFRAAYHDAIDPNIATLPDEHRDAVARILTDARVGGEPIGGLKNAVDFAARDKLGVLPRVIGNIDADGFKAINDTFGHEAGDEVIRQIGQVLSDSFGSEAAWHQSGDEFHVGADTGDAFDQAQRAAQDAASKIRITATMPDGTVITRTGVGLSFGRGATLEEAEHGLQQDKAARLAAGLRTERRAAGQGDTGQGQGGARVGLQQAADGGLPGRGAGGDPLTGVRAEAQRAQTGAGDSARAQPVGALPTGVNIVAAAGGKLRVTGRLTDTQRAALRAIGGRVGATIRGEHWTIPARAERVARDALSAPRIDAGANEPAVHAAAVPGVQEALRALDSAIAERTAKGPLHDFLLKTAPMAAGTDEARAAAKDFANNVRLARWEGTEADKAITREFTPEQQARMWQAADAESIARVRGEEPTGGLGTLSPKERAAVEHAQAEASAVFEEAKRAGMVGGDAKALPSYVPRMLVRMTDAGAERFSGKAQADLPRSGLRTMTGNLLKRKHLESEGTEAAAREHDENAEIVRNIRTLPLATAKLKEAIAGRTLINQIREIGERAGGETVAEGRDPSKADQRWFTMPENPAFYTWKPKTEHATVPEAFDKHLWDGLTKLAGELGVDPQRLATMRGRQWGNASRLGEVNTRFGGPETVLTHELGHILDFKYGLANKLTRRGATATELRALADLRHEGVDATDGFKRYVRQGSEKIANMVHAFVHMPVRFKEVAPTTFRALNEFLDAHPELSQLRAIKPSLVLGSREGRVPVTQWERVPLYVRGDFEGPLRAALGGNEGAVYRALMSLKQKTMGVIMYSPIIHNAVEWGRALPAMPGKVATFKVYFDGNRAKNDPATMREAIQAGLSPIGDHGSHNDVTSIANTPNIKPGRSWTSQVLAYVPGLFDHNAGDAVKRWVDKAGDVWHNTLLWDRVADLQMGLYTGLRDDMLAKGLPDRAAQIAAAHMANRYAGTLPREAMSESARKIANLVLFSRTFTLGNLGAMKDAVAGLPKDAQAQIARDCSVLVAQTTSKLAKRKALATVILDIGLSKVMNAVLQTSIACLVADATLDKEGHEYARRLNLALQRLKENPLDLLGAMDKLSPLNENEPDKRDRVLVGHTEDGTAIYMRNPAGKIGEEFLGWTTKPLDQLKAKLSTFARPILQTAANDKGYGQHVYDPYDDTAGANMRRLGRIAELFIGEQLPLQAIDGARDYLAGRGDATLNAARVLGPLAGLTFSQGAPGGEAVGEMYRAREQHDFNVQDAMPAIREKIKTGDMRGAVADMAALGIKPGLMEWYIRSTLNPRLRLSKAQLENFERYATPEERQRLHRDIGAGR